MVVSSAAMLTRNLELILMIDFRQYLSVAMGGVSARGRFTVETIGKLDAMGAFNGMPALRFMAVTAVKSGCFDRMRDAGGWNEMSRGEMRRFVAHTGFDERMLMGLFHAYADCLGWNSVSCRRFADDVAGKECAALPVAEVDPVALLGASDLVVKVYCGSEPECGLSVASVRISDVDGERLAAIDVRRMQPMGSGSVNYSVYDLCGAMIEGGVAAVVTVSTPCPLTVTVPLRCRTASELHVSVS